jgi:hypothetical protein
VPALAAAGGATFVAAEVGQGAATIPIKFNPPGLVSADGEKLELRGPLEGWCDEGTRVRITFTVSQEVTKAIGTGSFRGRCEGEEWVSRDGRARGKNRFEPGKVEACGLAIQRKDSEIVHVKQWCAGKRFKLKEKS